MKQIASSNEIVYNKYTHKSIDDGSSPQKVTKYNQNEHEQINARVFVDERNFFVFENLP
jgi:hypothetical protein